MKRVYWSLLALVAILGGVAKSEAGVLFTANGTGASGSIQTYVVPTTGYYHVWAAGAQGASGTHDFSTPEYQGGRGALLLSEFHFNAGDVLQIAVGQHGLSGDGSGGGGGGSFVVDSNNNPLLIAAGGGGTRAEAGQNGFDGQAGMYGTFGTTSNPTGSLVLDVPGVGQGGNTGTESWGSGGAGFFSNGANDAFNSDFGSGTYGFGGNSWANGLTGGTSGPDGSQGADGGFGGGGSGAGSFGGGGGGGYSGGDGGFIAGGGGSFDGGIVNAFAISGFERGDGFVEIGAVPEPSSMILFGLGAAVLGLFRLRRRGK